MIKIYKTIVLPVVSYVGCETSSFALRKDRLRVFVDMLLRRIFRPQRQKVTNRRNYTTRSFIICTLHQILLG
jgi:hypothetical protein